MQTLHFTLMGKGPIQQSVVAQLGCARATDIKLNHNTINTPVYMPVGTQGTLKGITSYYIDNLNPKIMLSNTFFLHLRPGTDVLNRFAGLHNFSHIDTNILTDSGGFQMVSLLDLSSISEEGVTFVSPVDAKVVLLTPEESIKTYQAIGSDIMMVLDDVVSAELDPVKDRARIEEASQRTTRWLDRCISAHTTTTQTLFAIVQGHLDYSEGGLRDQCINDIIARQDKIGGIAIGGLSGGEAKEIFWRVVKRCCDRLPPYMPRYCMGVGYPVDLVVCVCLGVDMFDCVYATRTGRFGTAFSSKGELVLTRECYCQDFYIIEESCNCECCSTKVTRSYLNCMLKEGEPAASSLVSIHNVAFLLNLMSKLREAIITGNLKQVVNDFLSKWSRGKLDNWVIEALQEVGIMDKHHI